MKRNTKNARGFTLIELVVVMAIMGLLFNLGVARYVDFNRRQSVITTGLKLKNDLRSIQQKALSGLKPITIPCTELSGYVVHLHTTELREFSICNMAGTTVPPIFDSDPNVKAYPLPPNFQYGTTVGGAFQSLSGSDSVYHVLFKVLGAGISLHNDPIAGPLTIRPETSQLITIRAYSNPYRYYSVCISGGGDIKDCGYSSGSPPVCACP